MALCPFAVHKLIPPGSNDPKITARAAVLHVDAGNASTLYGLFSGDQNTTGLESHFFVKKNGAVEQYRDTAYQADAAFESNDFAIQIETQGYGSGVWQPAQLDSIKRLLLWCHATHGFPLVKIPTHDGTGVGYHALYDSWNLSHHSCPGPDRIKQFDDVLVPWFKTLTTPPPAPAPSYVQLASENFHGALDTLRAGLVQLDKAGAGRSTAKTHGEHISHLTDRLAKLLETFPKK